MHAKLIFPLASLAMAGLTFTATAAPITVSSYTYGEDAESQPQPTDFQGGSISDVGDVKLTDGQLATGSWNDGTNVGFRNDTDNGNPQPRVTFDLGETFKVMTIDVWSVSAFLTSNESVSISSSADGVAFSAPLTIDPLMWSDGFENTNLRQATVDVSALPGGQFYQLDFLDPAQWMMINEIQFDGDPDGPDTTPPTLSASDIVDDQAGGPVFQNSRMIYTVSFSDDMDESTVDAADFGNAGSATISIGSITETGFGVFTVEVTPTSTGTVQLQVPAGASMTDDGGNPLDTATAIIDDTSITVDPPDTEAPTLASSDIVDDRAGEPVNTNATLIYTVTFSEDMDEATLEAADLGNAGSAAISIGAIAETDRGVFSIGVTPTAPGTLQLEIVAGASVADASGNALETAAAITDDTTLTVEDAFPNSIAVSSYTYGANAESQPAPTSWQDGSISDLVDFQGQFLEKLTDGQLATGGWKDFTNVGFRNDNENGEPQPRVTFDLGSAHAVTAIDVWSVNDFLSGAESLSISSSPDGVTFSAAVAVNPLLWSGDFPNALLRQASVDVSSLPAGRFYQLDFFDLEQWHMINEIVIYGDSAGSFAITQLDYSPGDDQVTLTWDSQEGASYAVKYSRDMKGWDADLDDSVDAAAGDSTTATFDLAPAGLAGAGRVYFRVERVPAG